MRLRHLARLSALIAAALVLAGCEREVAAPPAPVRPVLYTAIVPKPVNVFGPFAGTIEARYQSQLGFQTTGRMVARDVSVGDVVRKGDRLAALDVAVLRFAVTQAKADVANAEAQLVNANATEARKRSLIASGAISQSTLDSAAADKNTATARLQQAQAALQKARDQLGYTELHADFDGVVTAWTAEIGQVVTQGTSVVSMARPDIREAVFDVPDDVVGRVHAGEVFTVALQTAPSITSPGRVREVAPSADESTRTRRIRLSLEAPSQAFRLGSTVAVSLSGVASMRIEVPASALLERDGRTSVWTIRPGENAVALRDVTIASRTGEVVVVSRGLSAGDRVVTAGVNRLAEGQPVKLSGAPL